MTENDLRQKMVDVMTSWLGRKESDGSHRMIVDIYNSQDELPRGYKVTYRDAWCATTVTASAKQAGCLPIVPAECSCNYMIRGFQKLGRWEERDDYHPHIGDIIFYNWQGVVSLVDDTGSSEHVGVVAEIRKNDMVVIEGNKGHAVARRPVPYDWRYIRGFGLPDYRGLAARRSVSKLRKIGALDGTSGGWCLDCVQHGSPRWMGELIGKAADRLKPTPAECKTVGSAVNRLALAGIIQAPDYWMRESEERDMVGNILISLAKYA